MRSAATLSISPNRTQFFAYEKISLWCTVPANSSGWSVRRNALSPLSEVCSVQNVDSCNMSDIYPSDSGTYWCESQQGVCSNKINITVTGKNNLTTMLTYVCVYNCLEPYCYSALCYFSRRCDPGESANLCVWRRVGNSSLSAEEWERKGAEFRFQCHVFQKWSFHRLETQRKDYPPSRVPVRWGLLQMYAPCEGDVSAEFSGRHR